jgi:hypothetical protein
MNDYVPRIRQMNVWEWESFESVVTPHLFRVTHAGPLLGPIQHFSITRDSKRRLNLETLVVGETLGGAVDHPAGTVRRITETVEFAGAFGESCVAHGVSPHSLTETHDSSGVKRTQRKSGIYSVKALLKPDTEPAFVIEWIENLNRGSYAWSGSILKDKKRVADTRTIGAGDGEITFFDDRYGSGDSTNTSGARLVVGGNECYIFCAGPRSNEV